MRSSSVFTSLLAAASTVVAAIPKDAQLVRERVPGAFIFELEDGEDASAFYDEVSNEGSTRMELDFKLFKGVSVQLEDIEKSEEKAFRIASTHSSVKKVYPVELFNIPKPQIEWVGTPTDEASPVLLSKRDDNTTITTFTPHVMTQVDKVRAKGITGKGIKVAVIDTGIDYKHPALGGCFGPGCLVAFGTDLVGDEYSGSNTPAPDDDPMDCQGHGTHVAGTVAAQLEGNLYGFTGAAPGATLGAYRVFGCDGSAGNDVLIAAYMQAFEDGADIITASIGGPSGWSEDPWAVAVSRIVEAGVPCPVSAGNEGDQGLFYASTAANGKRVSAIASYNNIVSPTLLYVSKFSVDGGKDQTFGYTAATPADWEGVNLPLWAPSFDTAIPNGGCDPYPDNTPDLSEYIVLVRRGSCTFVQKAQNAVDKGAKYIILYNNAAGTGAFDVSTVPEIKAGAMVTPEVGANWIKLLAAGSKVDLKMTGPENADLSISYPNNTATGGALSTFTTWGPTYELDMKPQFGAPGGSILSTYPLAKGAYAVLSGTSMACPLVAGAIALIAEARGEKRGTLDPELVENLLSSHASPALFNDGAQFYEFLAPVPQQGGGLIQVDDAAYASAVITPSGLSFNDTANFNEVLNFTLSNVGKEEVTFAIGHVSTVSMYTFEEGGATPAEFPNEPVDASATLSFSEDKVTVAAGDSVTIEVIATPPADLDFDRLGIWSGWISATGSDGSSLSIPYQGATGSIYEKVILSEDSVLLVSSDSATPIPAPANTTFTLVKDETVVSVSPAFYYALNLGTANLRADIVPLTTCPPDWTEDLFGTKTIGQPEGFPRSYLPRGTDRAVWNGKLDNGEWAPAGKYKFAVRALRITGDAEKEEDWDLVETIPFRITYKEE